MISLAVTFLSLSILLLPALEFLYGKAQVQG